MDDAEPRPETLERKVRALKASTYFGKLSSQVLGTIAGVTEFCDYESGEVIVRAGATPAELFVLERGEVDVFMVDRTTGSERLLRRLDAGACFGELGLLTGRPRTAHIRARERGATVLKLRGPDFTLLLSKLPPLTLAMAEGLADWLYGAQAHGAYRFVKLGTFPVQPEVATLWDRRKIEVLKAAPLAADGARVVVGMVDPTDLLAVDAVRRELPPGATLELVAVMESELARYARVALPKLSARLSGKVGGRR